MSGDCLDVYVERDDCGCPAYSLICDNELIARGRMLAGNEFKYWSRLGDEIIGKINGRDISEYNVINKKKLEPGNNDGSVTVMRITPESLDALAESLNSALRG